MHLLVTKIIGMDDNYERSASEMMVEAESKLDDPKSVDEAAECYQNAGNLFRKAKNWYQAGKAYSAAAKLLLEPGKRFTGGTNYVNAFKCYRKSDKQQAINCLMEAIDIFGDIGEFSLTAEYHQTMADMYRNEMEDLQHANQHYEQAAEIFNGEDSPSEANRCLLKVAQIAAQLEDYEKAISIFEEIVNSYAEIPMLKCKTVDFIFRSSLCHLTTGLINGQEAIERYAEQYPAFESSNECKLLQTLCEHLEEANIEGFIEAIEDYEGTSKIDEWCHTLLLRIQNQYT